MLVFGYINGQNCLVDSIFLVGFDINPTFSISQDRKRTLERFCDYLNNKDSLFSNYVDSMITNQDAINLLLHEMNKLPVCDTLSYSSNQILMNARFSIKKKSIRWLTDQEKNMDNRMLLLLFMNGKPEFVWLGEFYLDRGDKRYLLSKDFRLLISKYSHLYQTFLQEEKE